MGSRNSLRPIKNRSPQLFHRSPALSDRARRTTRGWLSHPAIPPQAIGSAHTRPSCRLPMEGLIAVSLARRFGFFRAREPGAELRAGRTYSGVQPNHPPLSCARPPLRLGRTAALRRVISRPAALEKIHRRQDFLGVDDRLVLPHAASHGSRRATADARCQ